MLDDSLFALCLDAIAFISLFALLAKNADGANVLFEQTVAVELVLGCWMIDLCPQVS
jgi:hypothetical protein